MGWQLKSVFLGDVPPGVFFSRKLPLYAWEILFNKINFPLGGSPKLVVLWVKSVGRVVRGEAQISRYSRVFLI